MSEVPTDDQSDQDKQLESRIEWDNRLREGGAHVIGGALKITGEQQDQIEREHKREEMLERSRRIISELPGSDDEPEPLKGEVTPEDVIDHLLIPPNRPLTPFELEVIMLGIDAEDHGKNGRLPLPSGEFGGDLAKYGAEFMAHVARIDKSPAAPAAHGQIQRWAVNIRTAADHVKNEDLLLPMAPAVSENWAFPTQSGRELTPLEQRAAALMVEAIREGQAVIAAGGNRSYVKAIDNMLDQVVHAFGRDVPLAELKGSGRSSAQAWLENFRAQAGAAAEDPDHLNAA